MKYAILTVVFAALLISAGCCSLGGGGAQFTPGQTSGQNAPQQVQNQTQVPAEPVQNQSQTPQPNQTTPPTGQGTIVDVGGSTGGSGSGTSQVDCSTLSPTCTDCVAKAGCGWCKNPAGCYKGDSSGPSEAISCQAVDWATTSQACEAPAGGSSCSSITNCADCLSGSGCQWCIAGSVCRDVGSGGTCASGGWKTKSFECYAGQ